MVWGTHRFQKHTTLQNGKKWPKKSAPECPVECGGVQSLFGQCLNVGGVNLKGSSLKIMIKDMEQGIESRIRVTVKDTRSKFQDFSLKTFLSRYFDRLTGEARPG